MDAILRQRAEGSFIDITQSGLSITKEEELNDLLSLCYVHDSNLILVAAANLSPEFFNLRSGLAGAAMQKFANYQAKVAVVLAPDAVNSERFKELVYEMNQSNHFRFYDDVEAAEEWLVSG